MNKKEVTEIKKQFTPSNCAITRICGCYVDGEKEKKTEMKDQKSTDVKYDVIDLPSQNDNRFVFEWED